MNESLYKEIKIAEIIEEYPSFRTVVFEDGHGIGYRTGQYLTLVKTHHGKEIRRSYSITSSPLLNERLAIGVKRVPNGYFSRQLVDQAKPGDKLLTTGSGGFFVLPDDIENYKQLFFFAAGSGITPVLSLIKTALYQYPHLQIVLVYSNPSEGRAAYLDQLRNMESRSMDRFKLVPLFSNDTNLYRAHLHRDLLLQLYREYKIDNDSKILFYNCGPESYMRLVTWTLQEHGVPAERIKKENFVIHTVPKSRELPPDRETRVVRVEVGSRRHAPDADPGSEVGSQRSEVGEQQSPSVKNIYQVRVDFPDSILQAAKKQGIVLPYSCEAGRCGNCVAQCTSGKVWHSYNEVLTDKDLEKGLVLTCTGHPVGDKVVLSFKF